jgi:beta-lactamase regulating signal transducer with metallopeptidase domain
MHIRHHQQRAEGIPVDDDIYMYSTAWPGRTIAYSLASRDITGSPIDPASIYTAPTTEPRTAGSASLYGQSATSGGPYSTATVAAVVLVIIFGLVLVGLLVHLVVHWRQARRKKSADRENGVELGKMAGQS